MTLERFREYVIAFLMYLGALTIGIAVTLFWPRP